MTDSDVIALTVAVILVVGCCYLVLGIVIRGRLEISGCRVDWRTNPVYKTFWLISLLVCPVIIVWGFVTHWRSGTSLSADRYRIYVEMHPNIRPHFRYEGPGVHRALMITEDDAGEFQVAFSAMTLPPGIAWELNGVNDLPEYLVFDFVGSLSCSNGKCRLRGKLHSRERGELIILGSVEKVILHAGENRIAVEWSPSS
jgi:hypothetical protein